MALVAGNDPEPPRQCDRRYAHLSIAYQNSLPLLSKLAEVVVLEERLLVS